MDDSTGICHKCGGVIGGVSYTVSKEVIMLYDLECAQHLLSCAMLADLPNSCLSLKPADQPGKTYQPVLYQIFV